MDTPTLQLAISILLDSPRGEAVPPGWRHTPCRGLLAPSLKPPGSRPPEGRGWRRAGERSLPTPGRRRAAAGSGGGCCRPSPAPPASPEADASLGSCSQVFPLSDLSGEGRRTRRGFVGHRLVCHLSSPREKTFLLSPWDYIYI